MQKTTRTIYTWVKDFIVYPFEGLKPKSSSGRRGQLKNKEKKQLTEMLQHTPDEHGYPTGVWTAAIIQDLIFNTFGVSYSTGYIAQFIKGLGFSHKKALGVCYKADALKQKQWIEETYPRLVKQATQEGALILWPDESRYQLWSSGTYSWGLKGQPLEATVNMENKSQRVYGAICLQNGQLTYMLAKERKNKGAEFLKFLKLLNSRYFSHKIYVIIDNAPTHRGAAISRCLNQHSDEIELIRLPPYSPQLNPIERIWKKLKQKHFHNRFFDGAKTFYKTLRGALKQIQLSPKEVFSSMQQWVNLAWQVQMTMNSKFYNPNLAKRLEL